MVMISKVNFACHVKRLSLQSVCFSTTMVVIVSLPSIEARAWAQGAQPPQLRAAQLCAEGQRLYDLGDYTAAERQFVAGIAASEKSVQAPELRGGCVVQLANLQVKRKAYVNAEASARRAVAVFERYPFQRTLGLTTALTVLGDALEKEEKYSEAISVVERAWGLETGSSTDQAAQYRGVPFRKKLGRLYLKSKQYDHAISLLKENVSLLEKPGITGHTEVVPALNDLAAVYLAEGQLPEAETLLHRALSLSDRWPEEITAEMLLDTLDRYAQVMKRRGKLAEAQELAERASAIRRHYGKDAPSSPEQQ